MKLKILLALQVLFFAVFGGWLYINRENFISEFWLETIPVDPRDPFSGDYLALNYAQEAKVSDCAIKKSKTGYYSLWVQFSPSEKTYLLSDGRSGVYYEVKDCSITPVYKKNWAKLILRPGNDKPRPIFPSRYYLNEKDPRKNIPSGQAAVKVRIQKDRGLGIIELAQLDDKAKGL